MKVAAGGSCLDMNRNHMPSGTEFDIVEPLPKGQNYGDRQIPKKVADDWVQSGYAEPLQDGERSAPSMDATDYRERHADPAATLPAPKKDDTPQVTVVSESGVQSHAQARVAPPVQTAPSPWTFNPVELGEMDLENLNATIAGRLDDQQRQNFSPYASREEAIRHLSQDFQGGDRAAGTAAPAASG